MPILCRLLILLDSRIALTSYQDDYKNMTMFTLVINLVIGWTWFYSCLGTNSWWKEGKKEDCSGRRANWARSTSRLSDGCNGLSSWRTWEGCLIGEPAEVFLVRKPRRSPCIGAWGGNQAKEIESLFCEGAEWGYNGEETEVVVLRRNLRMLSMWEI